MNAEKGEICQGIIEEVANALESVDKQSMEMLRRKILKARKIYLAGIGRSGMVAACFAMRLAQMGLSAFLAGEVTTTAIAGEDLLILVSGSGNTESLVRFAQIAKSKCAQIALITAKGNGKAASGSDLVVKIPGACTKEEKGGISGQPMGTLFEQSALLLLDALALKLMESLGETSETMLQRHANLE